MDDFTFDREHRKRKKIGNPSTVRDHHPVGVQMLAALQSQASRSDRSDPPFNKLHPRSASGFSQRCRELLRVDLVIVGIETGRHLLRQSRLFSETTFLIEPVHSYAQTPKTVCESIDRSIRPRIVSDRQEPAGVVAAVEAGEFL